jgi:hypothetical protein
MESAPASAGDGKPVWRRRRCLPRHHSDVTTATRRPGPSIHGQMIFSKVLVEVVRAEGDFMNPEVGHPQKRLLGVETTKVV